MEPHVAETGVQKKKKKKTPELTKAADLFHWSESRCFFLSKVCRNCLSTDKMKQSFLF